MRKARFLLLSALLVVSGCTSGGSDDASAPTDVPAAEVRPTPPATVQLTAADLVAAVNATAEQRTAKVDIKIGMSGMGNGVPPMSIRGSGDLDYRAPASRFSLRMPSPEGGGEMTYDIITNKSDLFVKFQGAMADDFGGKWLKFDLAELAAEEGVDLEGIMQGQSTDPRHGLDLLTAASNDIKIVGTETLRGEKVTHYRATLDIARAAQTATGEAKAAMAKLVETYGKQTLPGEFWIDGDGRVRMITAAIDMSRLAKNSTPGTMTFSQEMYDFGATVDVGPPAPDQVTDMTNFMGDNGDDSGV